MPEINPCDLTGLLLYKFILILNYDDLFLDFFDWVKDLITMSTISLEYVQGI